jgi:hypothetical protein
MKYCCDKFKEEVEKDRVGFEKDNAGEWNIVGCCGSCYVVNDMRYCPFCGTELKAHKEKLTVNVVLNNPVFQNLETQEKAINEIVNRIIENYKNDETMRQAMKGKI